MTLAEIGRIFEIDNYSTVSSAIERIKVRKDRDATLQQYLGKLSRMITKIQQQT